MVAKIKKTMDRTELVAYLENLAAQLRRGHVQVAGRNWRLPQSLETKLKLKEKKKRLVAELKWHWSILEDYEPYERQRVENWKSLLQAACCSCGTNSL